MAQQGPLLDTRIKQHHALAHGVHERGQSYIDAALLILKHSSNNSHEVASFIGIVNDYWASIDADEQTTDLTKEDLEQLERILIDCINKALYNGERSFKKVKDELDNAENHLNWKPRAPVITQKTGNDVHMLRIDDPIQNFSAAQTKEWLRIAPDASSSKPSWFKSLASWERAYLSQQVEQWLIQKDAPEGIKNLGEYLGPLPTTIRRYPGSANSYNNSVQVSCDDGLTIKFSKIRTAVLVPYKMKANSKAKKQAKVDATTLNLEHMICQAINLKVTEMKLQGDATGTTVSLPILLQTLYSPPFQPPGEYNNEAMAKALAHMREKLDSKEKIQQFVQSNELQMGGYEIDEIDLMYSSRPVNRMRGPSWLLAKQQREESQRTIATLDSLLAQQLEAQQGAPKADRPQTLNIAEDALKQYHSISHTLNTLGSVAVNATDDNLMAEKAALEQIAINQLGGIRVGGCVSCKDREEEVSEITYALIEYYSKHQAFPPPPNPSPQDQAKRDEYIDMVARQYLTGHGQKLAGENANGCNGLKSVQTVFGSNICDRIKQISPEYGIDPKVFDPVKGIQRIAGLNKISAKTLKKSKVAELITKISNWIKSAKVVVGRKVKQFLGQEYNVKIKTQPVAKQLFNLQKLHSPSLNDIKDINDDITPNKKAPVKEALKDGRKPIRRKT